MEIDDCNRVSNSRNLERMRSNVWRLRVGSNRVAPKPRMLQQKIDPTRSSVDKKEKKAETILQNALRTANKGIEIRNIIPSGTQRANANFVPFEDAKDLMGDRVCVMEERKNCTSASHSRHANSSDARKRGNNRNRRLIDPIRNRGNLIWKVIRRRIDARFDLGYLIFCDELKWPPSIRTIGRVGRTHDSVKL
jgi:hypothetical protein